MHALHTAQTQYNQVTVEDAVLAGARNHRRSTVRPLLCLHRQHTSASFWPHSRRNEQSLLSPVPSQRTISAASPSDTLDVRHHTTHGSLFLVASTSSTEEGRPQERCKDL